MKKHVLVACTFALLALTSCGSFNAYKLYMVDPAYRYPAVFDNGKVRITYFSTSSSPEIKVTITNKTKAVGEVLWDMAYIDGYEVVPSEKGNQRLQPMGTVWNDISMPSFLTLFRDSEIQRKGYAERSVSIPVRFGDEDVFCNVRLRIAKNKKSRLKDVH